MVTGTDLHHNLAIVVPSNSSSSHKRGAKEQDRGRCSKRLSSVVHNHICSAIAAATFLLIPSCTVGPLIKRKVRDFSGMIRNNQDFFRNNQEFSRVFKSFQEFQYCIHYPLWISAQLDGRSIEQSSDKLMVAVVSTLVQYKCIIIIWSPMLGWPTMCTNVVAFLSHTVGTGAPFSHENGFLFMEMPVLRC